MSMKASDVTQGGQITAYRWRMYLQVNNWIFFWLSLAFAALTLLGVLVITPLEVIRNGSWYWFANSSASFVNLMGPTSPTLYNIEYYSAANNLTYTLRMSLAQMLTDPYMVWVGEKLLSHIQYMAIGCGIFVTCCYLGATWYIGSVGKKESEDEYLSGMELTEDVGKVNRLLKSTGQYSDLAVGDLHLLLNAEVMNMLIHGTVGVGKSTIMRHLMTYIRARGDRAIIYDSGGTFIESHYNPKTDFILNPHDERCANWQLWDECEDVTDFENLSSSLIPIEGDSDPFWVSSSRTIFADTAMRMDTDPDRNIEKFLTVLLSLDMKSLREYLQKTPSANLVEEKIEKTAISIRSVVTNYAKSLRFLQGLDMSGKPSFTIKSWMLEEEYDHSWLFISTTARQRASVRPLISMWLSLATMYLQSMGEDSERRVWFLYDEIANLQKIPEFNGVLAEGRKFGGCFVIGIQNMPQLINIYGQQVAKAIFDLLNTRFYGRNPSSEVATMVETDLGTQRRREARVQNSYGLDQVRDGISIGKDKVKEPIVDYTEIMRLSNLKFYVRMPADDIPVVKLALKYKPYAKKHPNMIARNIKDALSPQLEKKVREIERETKDAGLVFPTGNEFDERFATSSAKTASEFVTPVPDENTAPSAKRESMPAAERPAPAQTVIEPGEKAAGAESERPSVSAPPRLRVMSGGKADPALNAPDKYREKPKDPDTQTLATAAKADPEISPSDIPQTAETPERQLAEGPALASQPYFAALNALRRHQRRAGSESESEGDQEADEGGESQTLDMEVLEDDEGGMRVKTAAQRPDVDKEDPDDQGSRHAIPTTNELMADEETNILHHRDDYAAWEAMNRDEPEGFER